MTERGDESLRALEREVRSGGSCSARLRLASALERKNRPDEACSVLLEADKAFPHALDVRHELGRFRGPALGPWGAPNADARNTRLSPARGPRGKGGIISEETIAPFEEIRSNEPRTIPAPLLAEGGRPYASLGGRAILALTADGHAIHENMGTFGLEWYAATHEGKRAWQLSFRFDGDESKWSQPHAAIGPDATVYGITRFRSLIAIEPSGTLAFRHELPSNVLSLALDAERERLHLIQETPPLLSCRSTRTGEELVPPVSLASLAGVAHEAVLCRDGRVACVSPHGHVGIVSPDGKLEHSFRFGERIGGSAAGLAPWGELVVVSWDPRGAAVALFDPRIGKGKGSFEALECLGAPAIDCEGTIYLDGGSSGYVRGFDLAGGSPRYKLDRRSLWRTPDRPGSGIALGEGEVLFLEIAQGSGDAPGSRHWKLVRGGGDPEAGSGSIALRQERA